MTGVATAEFRTAPCKSCSAPVVWCITERGNDMPVDAAPAAGGNLAVEPRELGRPFARVVDAKHAFGRKDLHTSHFATCPHAGRWRRRTTRRLP